MAGGTHVPAVAAIAACFGRGGEGRAVGAQHFQRRAFGLLQALRLAETQGKLETAAREIAERDQRLSENEKRIASLDQEGADYQEQILKAYQRIKNDESVVTRAKKALAIALTLLDESERDAGDEASS